MLNVQSSMSINHNSLWLTSSMLFDVCFFWYSVYVSIWKGTIVRVRNIIVRLKVWNELHEICQLIMINWVTLLSLKCLKLCAGQFLLFFFWQTSELWNNWACVRVFRKTKQNKMEKTLISFCEHWFLGRTGYIQCHTLRYTEHAKEIHSNHQRCQNKSYINMFMKCWWFFVNILNDWSRWALTKTNSQYGDNCPRHNSPTHTTQQKTS